MALALSEDAPTLTAAHLQATALTEDRVKLALSTALAGEADLTEADGADERLLTLLGLRAPTAPQQEGEAKPRPDLKGRRPGRPGDRRPGRDPIGAALAPDTRGNEAHDEQAEADCAAG